MLPSRRTRNLFIPNRGSPNLIFPIIIFARQIFDQDRDFPPPKKSIAYRESIPLPIKFYPSLIPFFSSNFPKKKKISRVDRAFKGS